MQKRTQYPIQGRNYEVVITYKRQKNIYYRFVKGEIRVSCPYLTSTNYLLKYLDSIGTKLITPKKKKTSLFNDDWFYLFGIKYERKKAIIIDGIQYYFINESDFYLKTKVLFDKYIEQRIKYFSNLMNIPLNYKFRTKKAKSIYGSNSRKTNVLNFNLILLHYKNDIIDSVIVHELAHYFIFNHSKEFYDIVYKYCPNYKRLNKELKNGYDN